MLTGGNVNDCTRITQVMDAISVNRPEPGRPRTRPDHLIADQGYSTRAIRRYLRRRGIAHTIPERSTFNKLIYRHRNVVERCFNRLEQCRSVATRYDKTSTSFQATVTIAALLQWL